MAHGTSSGSSDGGASLLIFPAAAILFVLFLIFMHRRKGWTVLVTGGAGYIGSVLVPKLLDAGHKVVVFDLYPDGDGVFSDYRGYLDLREVEGDIRDSGTLARALLGCDAVIHLAGITGRNMGCHDPKLVKAVNLDAFGPLLRAARAAGVKRFLLASSYRVYGSVGDAGITEESDVAPTDQAASFAVRCEELLVEENGVEFATCAVRSAAVCGTAGSQRVDLSVNGLTFQALEHGGITIPDGDGVQPNIHVKDLTDIFVSLLKQPAARIAGRTYNAGSQNLTFSEIAAIIRKEAVPDLKIAIAPDRAAEACDLDYGRIRQDLAFQGRRSVADAVRELAQFHQTTASASEPPPEVSGGAREPSISS